MRRVAFSLGALLLVMGVANPGRALAQEPVAREPADAVPGEPDLHGQRCAEGLLATREHLHQEHHVDAHLLAQTLAILCPQDRAEWRILDAIALTHLEEHQRAHDLLEGVAREPGPLAARAALLTSWVVVEGGLGAPRPSAGLSLHDAARISIYARIHRGASPGPSTKNLSESLRVAVTSGYARVQASPHKRPWLAGSLSALLPGLGQAYAGSWQGAGISLVLNGLFAAATVELVRNELYFASATTGLAGSIFYVGNILNAVDLAQRYNEGASRPAREELGRLLVPEAHF